NGPNCHDCAWRSRWDRPRRKHRPTRGKCYRHVHDGSRTCGETSCATEGGSSENFAGARFVIPLRSDCAIAGSSSGQAAPSLGVTLFVRDIRSEADLAPAFDAGMNERVDGLIMTAESVLVVHSAQIIEFAARLRLPAVYQYPTQARNGGLMAYKANISGMHKSAALYVDKILKGGKPSDLPVQQPTKLSLVINLKTARAVGLELPQSLLARADEVID